ncbi:hypothetical protein [Vibrio harveyi]|uniref:hypothetical protein n=1 Tax=Vibrio harveyi TaxID=669 RepID=UPI00037B3231|nr:hypothetical protein [Vibrio harveyi]ELI6430246.1 metallophosphatase family protein [Vibrio harveyi]HDM8069836.1 metallophosphatase family protein [Vibrio harveyi]HDZ5417469.1 metallophosphatase family protein [Vibrio harveyi]
MSKGRSCPNSYRINLNDIISSESTHMDTIYVIGGLYGNFEALKDIVKKKNIEEDRTGKKVSLIFNGDFNWFNSDSESFEFINNIVLNNLAIQGNVEAELSNPSENAGCGCAYPDYVTDDVVVNSNLIMDKMKECSKDFPEINMKLGLLSKFKKIKIGKLNILILHGDVESIAGWKLSIDSMPDIGRQSEILSNWFESTGVDVFSCSHTCTPFIQNFNKNIVINNGTAGMPNFKNSQFGVITRISRCKSFITPLYGTSVDDVFIDAIPVEWGAEWNSWFEKQWPKGSPAWNAYIERIKNGTEFELEKAIRIHNNK